jgi:ATP-dependent exoDNAse (exonuclease V) beta subunit
MSARVIQAGAGTGKTHRLVTLCLQLFAEGLPPARLCAVTFTEKAAAELKGRIRNRVDGLASGGEEPEVPLREPAFWRAIRRDLGLAQVGTIHALCAQILRRHAAAAGLDPRFSVLDEIQARRLLVDSCEKAVLSALAAGGQGVLRLCGEMGLRTQGKFGSGLVDELVTLLSALGESGQSPAKLVEGCAGISREAAVDDDRRAREDLTAAMVNLRAALPKLPSKSAGTAAEAIALFCKLDYPPGELGRVWPRLAASYARVPAARGALAEEARAAKDAFEALLDADAGVRGAALARDLAELAEEARTLHAAAKARAAALDFDDLTRLSRDLFVSDAAARAAEQARIGALLVDEFQDTSRAQLELLENLAPQGELTVVGDRKQSIYEFRGADVAGAQGFAAKLLERGAAREVLQASRRSRPALVQFANALFAKALAPGEHPFDTPFTADDALTAVRTEPGSCAELLDVSGVGVEAEAEAVSRRISALLAEGTRGGEIAILLRRMTNLETFRRALLRRRIPHLVYKGRGFLSAREVLDVMALLDAAIDLDDGLALTSVLRSPFGPLSDDALVLLAHSHRLGRRTLQTPPPELAPDDAEALQRVSRLLLGLSREVDRLGPATLLEATLADSDYVAACAGGLYGEQAAANLDRLVGLARTAELRGESVRSFAAGLRLLADEEAREPEAPVVEERDPHAVRIMTIHAAKGLEFPTVFVPECATPAAILGAEWFPLEPDLGIACKVMGADGTRRYGPQGNALRDRRKQRELAQSRRLFYVAVTRAKDRVVLSGRAPRGESWRLWVDAVAPDAVSAGLLRILPDGGPAVPTAAPARAPVDPEQLPGPGEHPEVQRLETAARPALASVSAPVTQLADAAACPRRYHLLHELRLDERPDAEPSLPDPLGPDGAPATALGTLAHRLLELIPLPAQHRRAELERLLVQEGEDPAQHAQVLDAACAFLETPLGQRMAQAGPSRLKRELPFVLRLTREGSPELLVRGQIDALLLDGSAATVVDYKLSKVRPAERYAAQLDAYALAARELTAGTVPVHTGIVFLRTPGAPFVERPAPDGARLAAIREGLLDAGRDIAHGRATGSWPKVERQRCEALECGFIHRCHPAKEAQP